jgi:hypothetical protein
MLNITSATEFLTKEQIKERASSVFTTTASPSTSDHYSHISTEKILDDMSALGWGVVDAKQVRARKQDTIGFQKHLVVFRNEDIQITSEDGENVYPQILLTNSHDGKNAFTFTAGLFRMICENGLVISTQEFGQLKIRHMGYSFDELQNVVKQITEKLPLTIASLNKFREVELMEQQMIDFATKAIATRFTEDEINNIVIDFDDLLTPTRPQDKGNDLWSVYNVIQEKLTHGLFNYNSGGKIRKARKIKNFNQDLQLNERLYDLALEYVPVAA